MTKICQCTSGSNYDTDDCKNCKDLCGPKIQFLCIDKDKPGSSTFLGVDIRTFLITGTIIFIIFGLTFYYVIHVISKCHTSRSWLIGIITTILAITVTFIIYTPASVALFVLLMVVLTIYNFKCKSSKHSKK